MDLGRCDVCGVKTKRSPSGEWQELLCKGCEKTRREILEEQAARERLLQERREERAREREEQQAGRNVETALTLVVGAMMGARQGMVTGMQFALKEPENAQRMLEWGVRCGTLTRKAEAHE